MLPVKLSDIPIKNDIDVSKLCYGVDVSFEGLLVRYRITYCAMYEGQLIAVKWFYIYSKEELQKLLKYVKDLQKKGVKILIDY